MVIWNGVSVNHDATGFEVIRNLTQIHWDDIPKAAPRHNAAHTETVIIQSVYGTADRFQNKILCISFLFVGDCVEILSNERCNHQKGVADNE